VLSDWSNDTAAATRDGASAHTKYWLTLYFLLGGISIGLQAVRAFRSSAFIYDPMLTLAG
jgi:hypothetical protein